MNRLITVFAATAVAVLALAPAGNAKPAPDSPSIGAKLCVAAKRADRAAFNAQWGDHPMRACQRAARGEARQIRRGAVGECRTEHSADAAAFQAQYGTNRNGHNAFGKCVSSKVREDVSEETAEFRNAARECRAERGEDAGAFGAQYGTNRNGRNAFGRCVSSHVRQADRNA